MKDGQDFESLGELFQKKRPGKKPPAYEWQELALRIIEELRVPPSKRSSVFKACKQYPKVYIEKCFNDTKELCEGEEKWRYFFKLVNESKSSKN
jgi:hypothetical protein